MDRYEVMAGKMAPLTDGAHRKWGFAGKVEVVEPCKLLSIRSLSLPHKLLDACRAAMARTMARSRVDTCLGV